MKYINRSITKFIGSLALSFVFTACVDLEEDVSSLISVETLKTEGDITAALAPMYRTLQHTYRDAAYLRAATFGADDITTWWAGNKEPIRVFDRFDYGSGENADNSWLVVGWTGMWDVIYIANNLIDGLKASEASEEIVQIADGEARFMRGLCYFNLVRTHGGMPLILDGHNPTGEESRATVLETYQAIENDFKLAADQLPGPAEVGPGRVSSAAAKTALANLYLTWGGWPVKDESKYQLAATTAKEVIDLGYFSLQNINELWTLQGQNGPESIFSVQFSESENIVSNWPNAFSFHEAGGWSDLYPELQFFNDFPAGPRKDVTFKTEIPQRKVVDGVLVDKDPPTVPFEESQRFHPMYGKFTAAEVLDLGNKVGGFRAIEIFRYAEVLLTYAEAQARVGENASSIEALNQVKRRAAGLDPLTPDVNVDVVSATPDEIVEERGWELAGEYVRWFDLIRTEKVEEIAAKRDPSENVPLNREPTKAQYIAPIPLDAFLNASNIVQNPEGFKIQ